MGMKNDLSFLITNIINMYKQQSSYNLNKPVRKLMYATRMYDRFIHQNKLNIYGTKRIHLPVPKLVTLYNGKENKEDEIFELNSTFQTNCGKPIDAETDIDVRVKTININYDKNKELMTACKPLFEYALFIGRIRDYGRTMDIEAAIDNALNDMPENFEIKRFLIANKAKVKQMYLTEYNETETMELFREEGRAEDADRLAKLVMILHEEEEIGLMTSTLQDSQIREKLYKNKVNNAEKRIAYSNSIGTKENTHIPCVFS